VPAIPVNPPSAQLGSTNAVLWGRGNRSYYSPEIAGPLSIKTMRRGTGFWKIGSKTLQLGNGGQPFLVLNPGEPYSLTIEKQEPVETFCIFFRDGFVEELWRTATSPQNRLLEEGEGEGRFAGRAEFRQEVRGRDPRIQRVLDGMRQRLVRGGSPDEADFDALAGALLWLRPEYERMLGRLPSAKPSTRIELAERVGKARAFLEASMPDSSVTLADAARAACLSPFHLQRSFRQIFGETPRDYLSRRRMEMAARKLGANRDVGVTEVCMDCGFESLGSFSTAFRQRFGMAPREYREKFASRKK
jgi:AraC family transcriptional regulator